jgi:hypothetical protein
MSLVRFLKLAFYQYFIPNEFMIWAKDAKLFFIKVIYKNHFVALPTVLFFKEVLVKKSKHIRLNYISIWY